MSGPWRFALSWAICTFERCDPKMATRGSQTPPPRHWILCSILLFSILALFVGAVRSQETEFPPLVVTATPLPGPAASLGMTTQVIPSDLLILPEYDSIAEVLEDTTFVSVSERGGPGIQSDLSIRGCSFEQVLVTLDGVPLVDPQTGHHNMNLPFPMAAIGQVTAIAGPGSALFGPRAFGGVVDLLPWQPVRSGGRARFTYGSFDRWHSLGVMDVVRGPVAATASASYESSNGFREGTGYDVWTAWGAAFIDVEGGRMRVSVGHADRDFGARDFYAPFPSREQTSATLIDVAPDVHFAGWQAKAVLRYRHHDDEFILIESDPSYYRNSHETDSFTERLVLTTPAHVLGQTAVGVERSDADLSSSALGDHDAYTTAAFAQHRVHAGPGVVDAGLRFDHHADWGGEVSPFLSVAAETADWLTLRAAAGRAIRPPSFTELYYRDPSNEGNEGLTPEEAWGGELGATVRPTESVRSSVAWFIRDTDDVIDWVRGTTEEPWRAVNVGQATFQGVEIDGAARFGVAELQCAYRYTDVDADAEGLQSKSALNIARHDARAGIALRALNGFSASVSARYRYVPTLDNYWLLNARISKRVGSVTVFVVGQNLFDEEYEEIPDVPTAGVSVDVGIETAW